jgi:hypothetical protein
MFWKVPLRSYGGGVLTVYLDQKDWIGLAKATYRSDATEDEQTVAATLQAFADADLVRFPVTETHLVEAARIGKQEQRLKLANVFARFSRSWFLAGRQIRLPYEIECALAKAFDVSPPRPGFNAFAQDFLWAFGDYAFLANLFDMPLDRLSALFCFVGPTMGMLDYLAFDDDEKRRVAVERYSAGTQALVQRIEHRRLRTRSESHDMRSRIYSVLLFMDVQERLGVGLHAIGRTFDDLRSLPDHLIAQIVDFIPSFEIERCLALRAEREGSPESNDVMDIAALTAAIPYCDIVVTENSGFILLGPPALLPSSTP